MSRQRRHGWVAYSRHAWDAVNENDFEVAIDVFLNSADMVIEEKDRSDRDGACILEESEQGAKAAGGAVP